MYTLRAEYPEDLDYDSSLEFRNRKLELNWDGEPCSHMEELLNAVEFKWNSKDYLPIEFTYYFIEQLPIPIVYNKVINIKDNITYVKFLVPVDINVIINKCN